LWTNAIGENQRECHESQNDERPKSSGQRTAWRNLTARPQLDSKHAHSSSVKEKLPTREIPGWGARWQHLLAQTAARWRNTASPEKVNQKLNLACNSMVREPSAFCASPKCGSRMLICGLNRFNLLNKL